MNKHEITQEATCIAGGFRDDLTWAILVIHTLLGQSSFLVTLMLLLALDLLLDHRLIQAHRAYATTAWRQRTSRQRSQCPQQLTMY